MLGGRRPMRILYADDANMCKTSSGPAARRLNGPEQKDDDDDDDEDDDSSDALDGNSY